MNCKYKTNLNKYMNKNIIVYIILSISPQKKVSHYFPKILFLGWNRHHLHHDEIDSEKRKKWFFRRIIKIKTEFNEKIKNIKSFTYLCWLLSWRWWQIVFCHNSNSHKMQQIFSCIFKKFVTFISLENVLSI